MVKKFDRSVIAVAQTSDPIEIHILKTLDKLRQQNKRYKMYIEKSGVWAHLVKTSDWKPYHFYHYFCNMFQQKYKREYKDSGNIVRAYQRIELFMKSNHITKEEYKEFIDTAFARFFDNNKVPVIGSICSSTLFNHLMLKETREVSRDDWVDIDVVLAEENEEFERYAEGREGEQGKTWYDDE